MLFYEQEEYDTTKNISEKLVDIAMKRSHLNRLENPLKVKTMYKERTICLTFSEVKAESIPYFSW